MNNDLWRALILLILMLKEGIYLPGNSPLFHSEDICPTRKEVSECTLKVFVKLLKNNKFFICVDGFCGCGII